MANNAAGRLTVVSRIRDGRVFAQNAAVVLQSASQGDVGRTFAYSLPCVCQSLGASCRRLSCNERHTGCFPRWSPVISCTARASATKGWNLSTLKSLGNVILSFTGRRVNRNHNRSNSWDSLPVNSRDSFSRMTKAFISVKSKHLN